MWVWPLESVHVTSGFSLRRWHPVLKCWKAHTGVDLRAALGTPVRAASAGTVVKVGFDPPHAQGGTGAGFHVRLDHGRGVTTRYYHLTGRDVQVGQAVRTGDVIGHAGSTGDSTATHLHFEVRILGVPINPVTWLNRDVTTAVPALEEEPDMARLLLNHDGTYALAGPGPEFTVLHTIPEVEALKGAGLVTGKTIKLPDGSIWNGCVQVAKRAGKYHA